VSDGTSVLLDARASGDEPNMLARNLPGVPVVVDRDRVKGGLHAIRELGCDMLLLDDGLQYLRLHRRINVVLVDRTSPFGNGFLLPRGTMRESRRQLRRADYIFLTKCDGKAPDTLLQVIRRYNETAPILECRHKPLYLQDVVRGEKLPLEALQGRYVSTICALARPESFEESLKGLGATVEISRRFADHHYYTEEDLADFIDRCVKRGVDFIVTTEKDYVKFPSLAKSPVPFYFLRMEIEVLRGARVLDDFVESLCRERAMPRMVKFR
jgi:tetraacyldisaccharide 4'-kinase